MDILALCGYAPQSRDRVAGSANTFLCMYACRDLLVDLGPCMTIDQGGVAVLSKERAGN